MREMYSEEYKGYQIKIFETEDGSCICKIFKDGKVLKEIAISIEDCQHLKDGYFDETDIAKIAKDVIDEFL